MRGVYIDRKEARRRGLEEGLKEGLEEGLERGREMGRAEGIRDAKADMLLKNLQHRFETLPDEVPLVIREARLDKIEHWLSRALNADDPNSIFVDS